MSHSVEEDKVENLEFKWGKKRGVGGKKKEVQFYESFTYDGVDYTLYDCVYMHKEGELEPYLGKLVKIWERSGTIKKVKVQWFFRPSEIANWLGEEKTLENEIFLASGEGVGVANINPLEAIAGKCNVVCISKDSRNRQPLGQELEMADYVFYRTFDVRNCTISDRMDDKVAGLEVKFVFNKESEKISDVSKLDSDKKEEPFKCNQTSESSAQKPPDKFKTASKDGNSNHLVAEESGDAKVLPVEGAKQIATAVVDSDDVAWINSLKRTVSGHKATGTRHDSDRHDIKMVKVPGDYVEVEDRVKFCKESGASENRLSKKSVADSSVKLSQNHNKNCTKKSSVRGNDMQTAVTTTKSSERKTRAGPVKDSVGSEKGVKSAQDAGALDDRPSKKARIDSSVKLSENKNNDNVQNLGINSDGNNARDKAATLTLGAKMKSKVGSPLDIVPKQETDEKKAKLSNGKLLMVSAGDSPGVDRKMEGGTFEVTPRPDDERSRWFKALPWEERMKNAFEQGTLVELLNLDPEYNSREVEDIIWHAFKEHCTAKMVQHTAISSPHSGQAFIILKTKAAAERILKGLNDKCLMLSNGRPLVGSLPPAINTSRKHSSFAGHLFLDKIKQQMQREMKEAVSTSHCSQPNTIEYEMAMEWRLLQSRFKCCWKQLYKQQGEELRKLKGNLKLK